MPEGSSIVINQNQIEKEQKIARLKELGIENLRVGDRDFLRDVICKGKEFTSSIAGVGAMYDGHIIGENFTDEFEKFLKKLKFEDYGFILKLTENNRKYNETEYPDYADNASLTSFEITPLRSFSRIEDFKTASNIIMREKLIKFSRNTKGYSRHPGSECKLSIEMQGGKTFIIDEYGSEEEREKVMAEIKKEWDKILM